MNTRNYIITDATLAGIIQRNNRTLSFYSLIVEITRRLIAFDDNATKITFNKIDGEPGEQSTVPGGLMAKVHEMTNRHLGPGKGLDVMTGVQMAKTAEMLNQVPADDGTEVHLYEWLRHIFSIANAYAIYGPQNIFAIHPELEQAFWEFENGMLGLVIDIVPQITARKAFYARKRVLDGLVEYVKMERYKQASPLIQERVQTNLDFKLGEEMSGHAELILMFGILGNAVPSNFWLVANILSRPQLLSRIRTEVQSCVTVTPPSPSSAADTKVKRKCIISSKAIAKSCTLLYGSYRETLRDNSLLTSARLVMEDTLVADRYLLKKNSVVQIAGGVLHHSTKIWGSDAEKFKPERYLTSVSPPSEDADAGFAKERSDVESKQASPLPKGVPSAAFRAFGGGTVICPGRHVAQSELMALAAVLAIGFDITNSDGSALTLPEKDEERIPLAMVKPKRDSVAMIRRRKGWEDVEFVIEV